MSNARTARIVEVLGMPQGTAANKSRKMVLFRQLKKYGDNICYRCSQEINDYTELSIEHIQPWEGRSAELFWDLNNIAFSHLKCNVAARIPPKQILCTRKTGPVGTAWCYKCKSFLPVEQFYKDSSTCDGLNGRCIQCHKSRPR